MVLNFYSANVIKNMINKTPYEPFDSLDTLYSHTNYSVISEKDSVVHLAYEFLNIYKVLSYVIRYPLYKDTI